MVEFYSDISQFEPLMPANCGPLEDRAFELTQISAGLARELHPATLDGVRELLRIINSYYSNLIEGNDTHPISVERAMREDYSSDPARRDRQKESLIHIEVQRAMENRLDEDEELAVTSPEFLKWVHHEFYKQLPESLSWAHVDGGEAERVIPGEFRSREVAVGKHLPPTHSSIQAFVHRFNEFYSPARRHGLQKIVAIAAAHHRLMWIHPFLDGNGRVARLFTDAYFRRIGLAGYGLWNVSRGLARRNADYKRHLAEADLAREGDIDGRGNLSDRRLTSFCSFFLDVCIDQARYMSEMLALHGLLERIDRYVEKRNEGRIVDKSGKPVPPMPGGSALLLRETAIAGELPRNLVIDIVGKSERTARTVTRLLIEEGLLVPTSDWHRSPFRLGFPPHAAGYLFPNLFPDTEN